MKRLLITRDANTLTDFIRTMNALNLEVIAQPFIHLKALAARSDHPKEILFFGSKNGFDFYQQQFELSPDSRLACIGASTASHIQSKGFETAFIGTEAGNPLAVGAAFREWCGNAIPTLVQSAQSAGSIAAAFESGKCHILPVYETIALQVSPFPEAETIVFTSPSNVQSWCEQGGKHQSPEKMIAWGKSTEGALKKLGLRAHYTLQEANFEELSTYLTQHVSA